MSSSRTEISYKLLRRCSWMGGILHLQVVAFVVVGLSVVVVVCLTSIALSLKKKFKSSKYFRNASTISHLTGTANKAPNHNPLLAQSGDLYARILPGEQSAESEFQAVLAAANPSAGRLQAPPRYSIAPHFYFDHSHQDRNGWPRKRDQKCTPVDDKDRMLWDVVRRGRHDLLQQALSYIPALGANSTYGHNILHVCAVMCRKPQMAEMLLNTAPRLVNSRTVYGTTPLMQAIEHSHLMVANLLIIRGADVDAQDKFGRTALMRGAAAGNSITARFLVAFHADVNIVDKDGRRAVDLALLSGNARVASDLQGSALAIVPGYISPQMQTTCQASMLLLSVLSHFADVVTDALLMVALWRHGSRALAVCSGVFVLLPSLLVAAIPYQSLVERLLTILQLRLVYEALLSMNQDRLTVRYGAVQMLHTVLENIPQMMIQGYLLATASRNSDADGDAENVDRTLVIIAFLTSLLSSAKKMQSMYLKRLDNSHRDKLTIGGVGVGQRSKSMMEEVSPFFLISLIYIVLSLALRLTAYIMVLVFWHPAAFGILMAWVLLSRLRIAALPLGNPRHRTNLEWTVVDIIAACLSDVPFCTNCDALVMASTLSFVEMLCIFVGITLFWPAICVALQCASVLWWGLHLYMLVVIHGKHFSIPVRAGLWGNFLCFWKVLPLLWQLLVNMCSGATAGLRYYWGHICAYCSGAKASNTHPPHVMQRTTVPVNSGSRGGVSPTLDKMFDLSRLMKRELYALALLVCLLFCALSWVSSVFIGGCRTVHKTETNFGEGDDTTVECDDWFDDHFGAFGLKGAGYVSIFIYLTQLCEALTCPVAKHLKNVVFEERYYESFLQARALAPSITWHSEAYHVERRRVERRNADGTKSVHYQTVEVVTARASKNYDFDAWVDSSHDFPTAFTYAQMTSRSEHLFFDQYSVDNYNREYDSFMRANNTDVHQRMSSFFYVGKTTGPPIPQSLVYSTDLLYFVKYTYFLYAALLGCSFFYRWFITSLATDHTVTVTKTMRKYPPGTRSGVITNYRY